MSKDIASQGLEELECHCPNPTLIIISSASRTLVLLPLGTKQLSSVQRGARVIVDHRIHWDSNGSNNQTEHPAVGTPNKEVGTAGHGGVCL